MGLLNKLFNSGKSKADELLSTGELNWRLKPEIIATKDFPNYLKFITKLEEEYDIQFGLHNDVINELGKVLILKQPIYNKQNLPVFTFSLFFEHMPILKTLLFMGIITNHYKPHEQLNPKKEFLVKINTNKNQDLEIEEYEKYYWELLTQSFSIQGLSRYDFNIKGEKCIHKIMEENVRKKYS